jgi:hypothetical protein
MSHDRDHDHPAVIPPREPDVKVSKPVPDRERSDHPSPMPREPVDPRSHPQRA